MNTETIKEIDVQSVMTKSALPVGGYSVNPYVGCPHACKYCYASFMKRFTGHTEPWGAFLDVKNWKPIANPHKYDGERIVIGSVTDGYNPYEEQFRRTRRLLEELRGSNAEIMVCTKSDLVLRDLDLLKRFPKVTVSWSINTLNEQFRADMDNAPRPGIRPRPAGCCNLPCGGTPPTARAAALHKMPGSAPPAAGTAAG